MITSSGHDAGAPSPIIALYASLERQHQNKKYHIHLNAYSRSRIQDHLQTGKLSALDGAVRDVRDIIGTNSRDRDTLRLLVTNLFVAWCSVGNPFVAVPMGRSAYAPGAALRAIHLRRNIIRKVVTALTEHGFIEEHVGYFDAIKQVGRCTRIRATGRLVELFVRHALDIRRFRKETPLVILRDQDGHSVNITRGRLGAEAKRLHPALIQINSMLAGAEIQLNLSETEFINNFVIAGAGKTEPCTPPNPCAVALYRVFNGDFRHGGRFYGTWWQGIPRELRSRLTINGYPVVELDYRSLHPSILYLREGITLAHDPYIIPPYGSPYRKVFKLLLNCGINAASPAKAKSAVRKTIADNHALLGDFHDCLFNVWLNPAWDALVQKHAPIARHLGSGAGLELQRVDSDMAEYVMLKLRALGVPILGIHDSFVVPNVHERALEKAMVEAARIYAGGNIPIENKMPQNKAPQNIQFDGHIYRDSA